MRLQNRLDNRLGTSLDSRLDNGLDNRLGTSLDSGLRNPDIIRL